jgi:uncharacterized protein YgiM (DUF1202 family)
MNLRFLTIIIIPVILRGDSVSTALDKCCGRCVGSAYCTACTTCNYCKYCNSGGSCGVCGGGSSFRSENSRRNSSVPSYTPPKSSYSKRTYIQYFVNTSLLNVRSGPGLNYEVIDKISYYTKVKIESEVSSGWCFIKYINSNGYIRNGYVVKRFLSSYTTSE